MGFDNTILGLQPHDKAAMLVVNAKWCLVPRGEKRFCSWSPTWPLWCHMQKQQYIELKTTTKVPILASMLFHRNKWPGIGFFTISFVEDLPRTQNSFLNHISVQCNFGSSHWSPLDLLLYTHVYTVVFNHLRNNCDLAQDFIHKHHTI